MGRKTLVHKTARTREQNLCSNKELLYAGLAVVAFVSAMAIRQAAMLWLILWAAYGVWKVGAWLISWARGAK